MNHWTELSIEFAEQKNYLDELFRVYPLAPEGIRNLATKENHAKVFSKKYNVCQYENTCFFS